MEMRRALATEAKKRDGDDENSTPENNTAGHRLRNVSRETRFDGVQRVLLAAGAVEALLDLVRAAGGGRKYTRGRLRRFRVRSRFLTLEERERRP